MKDYVDAFIARDANGNCTIHVKRGKYKHWFELGKHRPTDAEFERALSSGRVRWRSKIEDWTKLF